MRVAMRENRGFSLIELLIVVAIILIIAAIAIPNLLKAKMAANEASASTQTRTLSTAQVGYFSGCGGYAMSMTRFGPASPETCNTGMGLLDNVVSAGDTVFKAGYKFIYTPNPGGATLTVNGVTVAGDFVYGGEPIQFGSTGRRSFCSTPEPSVVRGTNGGVFAPVPTTIDGCSGAGSGFTPK